MTPDPPLQLAERLRAERAQAEREGRLVDLTAEPDAPDMDGELDGELAAAAAEGRSAQALVLRFERDALILGAAEKAIRGSIKLYKSRKAAAQKRRDAGAWMSGREDAGKLSTGRALA